MNKLHAFIVATMILSLACVGSVLQVPTPTLTPDPPTPTLPPPPPTLTPAFSRYVVTADVLEVRDGAGERFANVGYLERGDSVTVYETEKTTLEKCSEWARIGSIRWVCLDNLESE